jgi:hypothetical protein
LVIERRPSIRTFASSSSKNFQSTVFIVRSLIVIKDGSGQTKHRFFSPKGPKGREIFENAKSGIKDLG